eukprot:NODE_889_length_1717_cov_99.820144_g723_i0.p1 GENE.NODE_889_length_1717_cov_99.820144_g723_i0~~NODE_889_length_1717_cov_99.820144_g723_i0.p1  ORF type:complete len:519 (-),score=180.74 NODE_889_length_1717_cov_99.820144_g723_i0:83-1639(-)
MDDTGDWRTWKRNPGFQAQAGASSSNRSPVQQEATVTPLEALRIVAVLYKAIERLELLSLLDLEGGPASQAAASAKNLATQGPAATAAPTSEEPGDGTVQGQAKVGNILLEQKRLEARYEDLLRKLTKKKAHPNAPHLDNSNFDSVAEAVQENALREELLRVADQLKTQFKQVCRKLNEAPNNADNWRKISGERNELISLLVSCAKELLTSALQSSTALALSNPAGMSADRGEASVITGDTKSQAGGSEHGGSPGAGAGALELAMVTNGSRNEARLEAQYAQFAGRVSDEKNEKIWADQMVKRERETNLSVKRLQSEVSEERRLKAKEIEDRTQRLADLKQKVRSLRKETKEKQAQRQAETLARQEAVVREAESRQRVLRQEIERLEKQLDIEQDVVTSTEAHLTKKTAQLNVRTQEWTHKQVEDAKDMEEQLISERKRREEQLERLRSMEERFASQTQLKAEREEISRRQEAEKKRRQELRKSEHAASTKIQATFKAMMVRRLLEESAKPKRKSSKK